MNKVQFIPIQTRASLHVSDIIGKNFSSSHTAFIGKCGNHPSVDLFLVTYDCVVLASDPGKTWAGSLTDVWVNKWVDVRILIEEQGK